MSSLSDFLFGGNAPTSTSTYGSNVTNVPQWYTDYTQGLVNKANSIAATPEVMYPGPRVAGFSDAQKQSFDQTRQNVGSYQPGLTAAGTAINNAGNVNIPGAAQPYIDNAAKNLPSGISDYINPYTTNVIDNATRLANKNYQDNILPQMQNLFSSRGQYGSTLMAQRLGQTADTTTEGLQSQALAALSDAYNTSGSQFEQDQARQAGLATTTGQLANSQANNQLAVGQAKSNLAQTGHQLGLSDASALDAMGQEQQGLTQKNLDTGYSDFLTQQDYDKNQTNWLSSVLRGTTVPTSTTTSSTSVGTPAAPSGLSQFLAGLNTLDGAVGTYNKIAGNARGGMIRFARGGPVVVNPLALLRMAEVR